MDATPALTLTVILVNAALGYIKRNIPTFDVDIPAAFNWPPLIATSFPAAKLRSLPALRVDERLVSSISCVLVLCLLLPNLRPQ